MIYKFTIPGRPITKKNHQRIFYTGGRGGAKKRSYIVQSKYYNAFERTALFYLLSQKPKRTITGQVDVCIKYWMPDKRSQPDLTGLMQATGDILEKAGIISNDKNIRHWGIGLDHSEIVGFDKAKPRQEITVKTLEVNGGE